MRADGPFVVVAIATTGLPTSALVGIAVGIVDPDQKRQAGVVQLLINQPAEVLQTGLDYGITEEMINLRGLSEQNACETVALWYASTREHYTERGRPLGGWRAWNSLFVQQVLAASPLAAAWQEALDDAPGRCVRDEATECMQAEGLLPRGDDGRHRLLALSDATRWARRKGHRVHEPQGLPSVATAIGAVAVALCAERPASVIEIRHARRATTT